MTWDNITNLVATALASVGGIGVVITALCTIIKTFGGNSVNSKIAKTRIDLDGSMKCGIKEIADTIKSQINTDITVDISSKINDVVDKNLEEQRQINYKLREDNISLRNALALVMNTMSDFRGVIPDTREQLKAAASALVDVDKPVLATKPRATITLKEPETAAEPTPEGNVIESRGNGKKRGVTV